MSVTMTAHPMKNWDKVEAKLWGSEGGNVFQINFSEADNYSSGIGISVHYRGTPKDAANLLFKIREALDKLPKTKRCTCTPDCQQIILDGELEFSTRGENNADRG